MSVSGDGPCIFPSVSAHVDEIWLLAHTLRKCLEKVCLHICVVQLRNLAYILCFRGKAALQSVAALLKAPRKHCFFF